MQAQFSVMLSLFCYSYTFLPLLSSFSFFVLLSFSHICYLFLFLSLFIFLSLSLPFPFFISLFFFFLFSSFFRLSFRKYAVFFSKTSISEHLVIKIQNAKKAFLITSKFDYAYWIHSIIDICKQVILTNYNFIVWIIDKPKLRYDKNLLF